MPIVNIDLSKSETASLDAIAKRELRARKNTAKLLLVEKIAEVEQEHKQTKKDKP